jgi:hypothetical protein
MTLEELKALLEESQASLLEQVQTSLQGVKGEILQEVDKKNSGTVSSLLKNLKPKEEKVPVQEVEKVPVQEEKKAPVQEEERTKLSLKALERQIADFKTQLEEKDKKLLLKELDGNLLSALNGKKVLNSGIALKAFKLENEGNLQQEDGIWYVKSGESVVSLDTAVDKFLETDFGKTLVPPTSKARGSGLKPQNTTVVPKEDSKKNGLDDLFLED